MATGRMTDTKVCRSCGRVMTWRKAWERMWDEVRYCSASCRRRGATIDPREAARIVAGPDETMRREW